MTGEFSVCQFFPDETYEYVRRYVSAEEAFKAFLHYCTSVGAKLGTTRRVIITDDGDSCNAEWKWADGVTYVGDPKSPMLGKLKEGQYDLPSPANPG